MATSVLLEISNRQKTRRVNLRLAQQLIHKLLMEWPAVKSGQLCFHLVGAKEMAKINGKYLNHAGSTDVITFDYRSEADKDEWNGEIFISVDDAVSSAPTYRVTWQAELTRYIVHGILHLRGYDDKRAPARQAMKRAENRLLKKLSRRFDLGKLERE